MARWQLRTFKGASGDYNTAEDAEQECGSHGSQLPEGDSFARSVYNVSSLVGLRPAQSPKGRSRMDPSGHVTNDAHAL